MMKDPSDLFRALADETRLQMLALLRRHGELCVCDVMTVLAITQSKASRHLRYLLNAELLQDRREAVWMHYRMADNLDAVRLALVDSVFALLDQARLDELEHNISAWMSRKCCDKGKSVPVQLEGAKQKA
jgi:ArsR family transcriptional regulator, arsenate/arsenite/antimonite-responsive transcriptional repressor